MRKVLRLSYYSHCIINKLIAKHAVIPSHSPVSAHADSVINVLRHFEFKIRSLRLKRGLCVLYSTKTVVFCDPPASPGGG